MENLNGDINARFFSLMFIFLPDDGSGMPKMFYTMAWLLQELFSMHFTDAIVSGLQMVFSAGWPLGPFRILNIFYTPASIFLVERKTASVSLFSRLNKLVLPFLDARLPSIVPVSPFPSFFCRCIFCFPLFVSQKVSFECLLTKNMAIVLTIFFCSGTSNAYNC